MKAPLVLATGVTVCLLLLAGCQSTEVMSVGDGEVTEDSSASASPENVDTTETLESSENVDSPEAPVPVGFDLELGENIGIQGVSPELIAHPDGGYLLLVTGMGQNRAYRSEDGLSFTPDPGMRLPMGSDYSLLQKADGTWLLYYVSFEIPQGKPGQPPDPRSVRKKVMVSQSANLSSFPDGVPTGISQGEPGPAWGVPDTYLAPDGTYRMMWVDMPAGEEWEVLRTATSPDGINFTPDEGYAITDGYVDPFMLKADDGDWVLLLSTTPADQRLPQKIFVATSQDGRTWEIDDDPLLVDSNRNYLDPAAVETSPGEWMVVISTAEKDNAISGPHEYVAAILRG